MRKKLDYKSLFIVDIEATCWENGTVPNTRQYTSEIIEVGFCLLDLCKGIQFFDSIIVRPKYSKVSEFCTKLTTLTQKDVDFGVSLNDAVETLTSGYNSRNYVWASYGLYDKNQFERELKDKNINLWPFSRQHINIKTLFALMNKLPEEVGMKEALEILNIPLEGTHHRGKYDAKNIAKIAQNLFNRK